MSVVTVTPSVLAKFPTAFLHRYDGKIASNNNNNYYSLSTFATNPTEKMIRPPEYRFIPLDAHGRIVELETPFATRGEFLREMRTNWKYVAIRCEKTEAFLSCSCRQQRANTKKTKWILPGMKESVSAWVEYSYCSTVGPAERFRIEYFPEHNSFAFRTLGGLYLTTHKGALALRTESTKESATNAPLSHRAWEITPLLRFSSTEPHVRYVAVINNSKKVIMKLGHSDHDADADDNGNDDNDNDNNNNNSNKDDDQRYLHHAKKTVLGDVQTEGGLKRGHCTHFQVQPSGDWHYYLRDRHGIVFLVVVSSGFSRALAGECVNDLRQIHKAYNTNNTIRTSRASFGSTNGEQLTEQGLRRKETIQKELEFLLWNYNEQNESLCCHRARKTLCEELETAIESVVSSRRNSNTVEAFRHLNDATETLRKNTRRSRNHRVSLWIWIGGGAAVGAGVVGIGMLGMLLSSGPGVAAAALVASRTAQVGAVLMMGSGASVGVAKSFSTTTTTTTTTTLHMWKRYTSPLPWWKNSLQLEGGRRRQFCILGRMEGQRTL